MVTAMRPASPARNRTNAAWLRARIDRLHDELLAAEVYNTKPLTSAEIRKRLRAMAAGEEQL